MQLKKIYGTTMFCEAALGLVILTVASGSKIDEPVFEEKLHLLQKIIIVSVNSIHLVYACTL